MMLSKSATYPARSVSRHLLRMEKELSKIGGSCPTEAIHQARVASRRLRNSFWLYKKLLPRKLVKEHRRIIVKNARLLGKARDIDIHILTLEKIKKSGLAPGGDALLMRITALLKKERSRLAPSAVKAGKSIITSGIPARLHSVLLSMSSLSRKKARALSARKIKKQLLAFFSSFKGIKGEFDIAGLHSLRISAKKLRYSLEEFDDLHSGDLAPFSDAAKQVQDILGDVHDMDVWIRLFPRLARKVSCPGEEAGIPLFESLFRDMRKKYYSRFFSVWQKTWGGALGKKLKRKIS